MAIDDCPCFNLSLAHRRVVRLFEEALAPLALTVAQAQCLRALFEGDGPPAKDLARDLQIDAGTLTPMLDRLERQGLIRRCPDPADRRATRICLEERAHRLRPAIEAALSAAAARLAAPYETDEFETLIRLMRRLGDEVAPVDVAPAPAGT